jgi:hypothetical protein
MLLLSTFCVLGAMSSEDKTEIQEYGLAHTVVIKILEKELSLLRSLPFHGWFLLPVVLLASDPYKLGTFTSGTIH